MRANTERERGFFRVIMNLILGSNTALSASLPYMPYAL